MGTKRIKKHSFLFKLQKLRFLKSVDVNENLFFARIKLNLSIQSKEKAEKAEKIELDIRLRNKLN